MIDSLALSLQTLYDGLPVALGVTGRDGRYVAANLAFAAIHGRLPETMVGQHVDCTGPDAYAQLLADLVQFDAGLRLIEREVACHGRHFLAVLQPVRESDGSVQGVTSVLVDITARKRMEQASEQERRHWQFHASHDHLTGLPNRRHLDDAIAAETFNCGRNGLPLSVLMMDVDYFKAYNDRIGHQRGDDCLRAISAQLRQRMQRHGDLVGRYGGEEFLAVLPATNREGAYQLAQHVLQDIRSLRISHPTSPYGYVTMSIGVACLDDVPRSSVPFHDALLDHADRALYAAKGAGRDMACIYPPAD